MPPMPDTDERTSVAGAPDPSPETERVFRRLLLNTLITGVTGMFVWWAFVFWAYLETESVVVTGVIGAIYAGGMAAVSPAFGTYLDHHRTRDAMRATTGVSVAAYALAASLYAVADTADLLSLRSPGFWALTTLILVGSIAAGLRNIALSTCVTLLVRADHRDRANGMVGTVTGVSFALTSVFSGLAIGMLDMGWALGVGVALVAVGFGHLWSIGIDEPEPRPHTGPRRRVVDVRGAVVAIAAVPGLATLIALSAFNNLLGGVFMALMDAYGLTLVSVETWGVLWAVLSLGFIVGGLVVARVGLGPTPVKVLVVANMVNWTVCATFTLRSSIVLLAIGVLIWVSLMPAIEAAEQTVLQRAIPYERQGRVFGFAQLVENAAAPLSSVAIAPLAEAYVMPSMTDGWAADHLGGLLGTGPERGIALVFTLAGLVGLAVTLGVRFSRAYRLLTARPPADAGVVEATGSVPAGASSSGGDVGCPEPPDPDALPEPLPA